MMRVFAETFMVATRSEPLRAHGLERTKSSNGVRRWVRERRNRWIDPRRL